MIHRREENPVSFGRVVASHHWLGIEREDDVRRYQRLNALEKALFWCGVFQAVFRIYADEIAMFAGAFLGVLWVVVLAAVIYGWGPF